MRLKELFPQVNQDAQITGIATDTRFVQPGFLFVPLQGQHFKGDEFIIEATQKGASAVVLDAPYYQATVPVVVAENPFSELLRILKIFYGEPFNNLTLTGVTGTDGKTTSCTIIDYLLKSRFSTAVMGTTGIFYQNESRFNLFTTPLLAESYRLLHEFVERGITHVTMEVSSEGIIGKRIEPYRFDYGVYTNLSHEHLNTHKSMEEYFEAKFRLFRQLKPDGLAIVNKDDIYANRFKSFSNLITYSIEKPSDFQAINIERKQNHLTFDIKAGSNLYQGFKLNKPELYNLANALPGIVIALKEEIPLSVIKKRLANTPVVPGRLEKIATVDKADIYVDFAHTPNAIANLLTEARKKTDGKLIIVCGATGNKDQTKRPLMGKIATELADYVVFTTEDPYDENPEEIIDQMTSEVTKTNYSKIGNRKSAISLGIAMSGPGDIVLVTGKGRETTVTEKGIKQSFSDVESIYEIVRKLK